QARGNALGLEQAEGDLRFDRIRIGGDGGEHGRGLRYAAAMRTAILALAVLGLAAGCGGEAPQPAASAPAPADPAHERVAQDWPLPATMPGSAMPDLVSVGGSRLLLSWIHSPPGRRPALADAGRSCPQPPPPPPPIPRMSAWPRTGRCRPPCPVRPCPTW